MNECGNMHKILKSQMAWTSNKVALVSCSNGLSLQMQSQVDNLVQQLQEMGLEPVLSPYMYAGESVAGGTVRQRAGILMEYYRDPEIGTIFDVSGGDIANEILPYLDYEVIEATDKLFWGYSDLTTVINAIYARTGKSSVLYQVRNLIGSHAEQQKREFGAYLQDLSQQYVQKDSQICDAKRDNNSSLFDFPYKFLQGDHLQGTVVGGNIRCLLKLAGTPYWPDLAGKILFLEARSGGVAQMTTYLSQLQQMGAFGQVKGILLGTFTAMEREQESPTVEELVKRFAGETMPIVKTGQIGHGADSKAVMIGQKISLQNEK